MNRIAYTFFIAFVSSIATLIGIARFAPETAQAESSASEITLEELGRHDSADSCWKAIDGRVYDVTAFIDRHPTEAEVLTDWCGREATSAWYDKGNGRPHSNRATTLLAQYEIGVLEGAEVASPSIPTDQTEPVVRSSPGRYRDGSYYAESEPDSRGWVSIVEISVHDGRPLAVHYDEVQRDADGRVTARKSADLDYAQRWRTVSGGISQLTAFHAYAQQLVKAGHPDGVDALSGATGAYDRFQALVRDALSDASADVE